MHEYTVFYNQGFAAISAAKLDRRSVYDAIAGRNTYASNSRQIYLDIKIDGEGYGSEIHERPKHEVILTVASSYPLEEAALIGADGVIHNFKLEQGQRVLEIKQELSINSPFSYLRVLDGKRGMAWSSPFFIL